MSEKPQPRYRSPILTAIPGKANVILLNDILNTNGAARRLKKRFGVPVVIATPSKEEEEVRTIVRRLCSAVEK